MSTLLLDKLLEPSSVVIIGASARADSPGHQLTLNVIAGGYTGHLYLVNPRYRQVLGNPCHKSVKSLPTTPDLALILTPASLLKRTLSQCASKGIKVAIVMSGSHNTQELHDHARRKGLRLMGPFCAGMIRPHIGLNATFSSSRILKGNLAIVSQSASLGAATIDWAESNRVGFSALLSTGHNAEISLPDLLDLLVEDRYTRAIIVYVEHIKASRSFLSSLSATARIKPVVLMRSKGSGVAYCDALTRSGEIISSDDVFQSALNRAGAVRIRTFENLFVAARILSSGIRIKGKRVAILSNGNAPAMMAAERLHLKQFETPSPNSNWLERIKSKDSVKFRGNNPLLSRDAETLANDFKILISRLLENEDFDAVLVLFVPDSRNDPMTVAEAAIACKDISDKPLITCWMGDSSVVKARELLTKNSIPTFRTPGAATDALDFLLRYFFSQQQLLQLPNPAAENTRIDANAAKAIIRAELACGKRVVDPLKTRVVLELFNIAVLPSLLAEQLDDAISAAGDIGYPVALKLVSPEISYKASVVPTQLNISDDTQLAEKWQLIEKSLQQYRPDAQFGGVLIEAMHTPDNQRQLAVSITRDPVFGPVISLSIGGELTALMPERIVQLPPLNGYLIDDMLRSRDLQIYMGAFRHAEAVDSSPIAHVLRRLSELVCELPEIFSLDINPLIVSEDGAIAMDAQLVLETSRTDNRYQHLAIHPYPWEWIRDVIAKDGSAMQLRPIRPDDATALNVLVSKMSAESRYFRFMHTINELTPFMMAQFTKLDYDRHMAFVATSLQNVDENRLDSAPVLLGVSRYTISTNRCAGEFAVAVSDESKGKGIASALMRILIEHATLQGIEYLTGDVLRTNKAMQHLMQSLGFSAKASEDDAEILVYTYPLKSSDDSLH